jgi:hypothetical protein
MTTFFKATHEVVFKPAQGRSERRKVMVVDGCAYTRTEWHAFAPAVWTVDGEGRWWHRGEPTPNGRMGTVRVREL